MSEHAGLNRVRIRLAVTEIAITWDESQELKRRAVDMPGTRRVAELLSAVGTSRPADASRQDVEAIVAVCDAWEAEVGEASLPDGIRKLAAAARAELS